MKKKIIIILTSFIVVLVLCLIGLITFYKVSLEAPKGDFASDSLTIVVDSGSTSRQVIDTLYNSGLIKNKYTGYIYLKLHKNILLQAGTYDIKVGQTLPEIIKFISEGQVVDESISVTFIEGKKITDYVKVISTTFGHSEEEILAKLSDKIYLQTLINKYWFLTDEILNDKLYYALEGYLYPNTYRFTKDASIETIIEKLLSTTQTKLDEYKSAIETSEFSVHEILTMASIVELEGASSNDRAGIAGVFYNRLQAGWSLGSDVTTYYGARVDLTERDLYQSEIDTVNDYNTRPAAMAGKLPIGPICNPSLQSISATLEPKTHDYFYFVADINKDTHFSKTYEEHAKTITDLKNAGLWFTY